MRADGGVFELLVFCLAQSSPMLIDVHPHWAASCAPRLWAHLLGIASLFWVVSSCFGSVFPSSLIKIACPLVLALTRSTWRHVHASTCLACRVAFVAVHRIAWVRRQRAGANPGGPPLLDLWLLCWSLASGVVVRCFIEAIFGHSLGGALFY